MTKRTCSLAIILLEQTTQVIFLPVIQSMQWKA